MSLVFNDTTTKQGILQDVDFLVNSDRTTYFIEDVTRNVNNWYARAVSLILESDGRWQWDDSNWTDYPIGKADLVTGQTDYSMFLTPPDNGEDYLRLAQVLAKNSAGTFVELQPIDRADASGTYLDALKASTGEPLYYDKIGPSLFLYPSPSYNSTLGLQVYYQRAPSYFTASDTTKRPGIASIFHRYLSFGAALDFAVTKTLPATKIQELQNQVNLYEAQMKSFYAKRNKDEQVRLVNGQNRTSCGRSLFR